MSARGSSPQHHRREPSFRRRLASLLALLGVLVLGGPAVAAAAGPGQLDPSFGSGGVVNLPTGTQLFAVSADANGNYVAAGQSGGDIFVERFTPTGATSNYLGAAGVARAVAIQPDGKIVVAGSSGSAMFVERLTSALQPDTSFGSGGMTTVFGGTSAVGNAVAVAPDGKIVVAGAVSPPNTSAAVAEFTAAGALDQAFAGSGSETFSFGGYARITAIAAQSDGKFVFVGSQTPSQTTNGVIGRLNADGGLDGSFANGGGSGVFTYHYPGGGYTSLGAVTIQTDGKIVVAGVDAGGPNAIVLRLLSSGGYDSGFGNGGVAAVPAAAGQFIGGAPIGAYGVAIAGGGRIVAAGNYERSGADVVAATSVLSPGGSPDSAWGSGGTITGPGDSNEACGVTVSPDGSIAIVGNTVTNYPDQTPCSVASGAAGFIARYGGFGAPPTGSPGPTGSAPAVTTGGSSAVTSTGATVSGEIDPHGLTTSYYFEYGPTASYGSRTPTQTLPAKTGSQVVTAQLSNLTAGTVYHYHLVASNADGSVPGSDQTFQTTAAGGPAPAPAATTGAARAVTGISATLTGQVDPRGSSTTYTFQYGPSTAYGSSTPSQAFSAGAPGTVSAGVARLRPGTTYHYRLVATSAAGTSYGRDAMFRTASRLGLRLGKLARSYSVSGLAARGLTASARCSASCTVRASLFIVLSRAEARRLKLHGRRFALAGASLKLRGSHSGRLHLVLSKAARAELARSGARQLVLVVAARPSLAGPAVSATRTAGLTP